MHAHSDYSYRHPFYYSMKVLGAEGLLEPGWDVSTSGGRGGLEAAQAGYPGGMDQYWEQMRKRALETKWTKKQPV